MAKTANGNICVVGTGLAGLSMAFALAEQGFPVTLVGPMPEIQQDERTTAILMPGIEYLKTLGLWPELKSSATALAIMELIDAKKHMMFDAGEIGHHAFGYNVRNYDLKNQLVTRLEKHASVTWHRETARDFTAETTGWEITLVSGETINCRLLIGADGYASPTRQAAGIAVDEKQIDQSALISVLHCEKPHYNTSAEWYVPGGTVTLVPMPGKKMALVMCDFSAQHEARMQQDTKAIETELNEITNGRFGTLSLVEKPHLWPVRPMKAQKLVANNCALIGEAAHILPPIGAQGFNITLHDIIALMRVLEDGRGLGLGINDFTMLRRYEEARLPEIALRYRGVNMLNRFLQSRSPILHGLRRFSLSGLTQFSALRHHMMRKGMKQKT